MNEQLPSLIALRAFEAAARHLSMTLAAAELNVTPGAISLQVRDLEETLGVRLFQRKPRAILLTAEGRDYYTTLKAAFALVREATATIVARGLKSPVVVSCSADLATRLLIPRLARFESMHPDAELRINVTDRMLDLPRDGVDFVIRHGGGNHEALERESSIDGDVCSLDVAGDFSLVCRTASLDKLSAATFRRWLLSEFEAKAEDVRS